MSLLAISKFIKNNWLKDSCYWLMVVLHFGDCSAKTNGLSSFSITLSWQFSWDIICKIQAENK